MFVFTFGWIELVFELVNFYNLFARTRLTYKILVYFCDCFPEAIEMLITYSWECRSVKMWMRVDKDFNLNVYSQTLGIQCQKVINVDDEG